MNLIDWSATDTPTVIAGREKWDYTLIPELRDKVKPLPPDWQPPEMGLQARHETYTHVKDWPT